MEALLAKKANNTYRRNTFYHIKEESAYTVLTHNTKQYTNMISFKNTYNSMYAYQSQINVILNETDRSKKCVNTSIEKPLHKNAEDCETLFLFLTKFGDCL